ncbi:hypothetical protein Q3G72_031299 [Acer saccharum]|nr:hypothetical protein Q3G72_031299 [Acer saccharum]
MSSIYPGRRRPLLFAHRGASRLAPENTLEAFDLAVRLGVDVLEMDVHMTRDGQIVVVHDAELSRTTDGHGLVCEHSYAELQQLDAGARFLTAAGEPSFKGHGVVIPRLEDVLGAFPKVGFNIEVKQFSEAMIPAVLRVLDSVGPSDVLLAAGEHPIMQQLEAAKPACPLGLSGAQAWKVFWTAFWGRIPEAWRGRALQVPSHHRGLPVLTKRTIARAHRAGLDVHLWTVNSLQEARHWLALGVDGIMSDEPSAIEPAFYDARAAAIFP